MSLVDLFNLVHPKAQHATEEQKQAWSDLMKGELASTDTWESEVSAGKTEEERKQAFERLILEGKMGYMAMLRNLNNFVKYGINPEAKARVIAKLTDPEEVRKSKQLPFRFYTAYQNVKGDKAYSDAIQDAMEVALENMPKFDGKMLVAVDTSGSMSGDPIQKAAVFAAAIVKSNNADVLLYDTDIKALPMSGRSTLIDSAEKIVKNAMGGGTNTGLVFSRTDGDYDRIFIISDNQSWAGYGVQQAYEEYKKRTGTDPFVYAIDIQGYGTTDLAKSNKVFHLVGWSERLLDFVQHAEKGGSIIDHINSIEL